MNELQTYCLNFIKEFIENIKYDIRNYSLSFNLIDVNSCKSSSSGEKFLCCLNGLYLVDEERSCITIRSSHTKHIVFIPTIVNPAFDTGWIAFYVEEQDGESINTPLFSTVMDETNVCKSLIDDLYELCKAWGKKLLLNEEAIFLMENFA